MNLIDILSAAGMIGGIGLAIGILLGVAGKKLAVEVDEREEQIRGWLPSNNCGGCGFAGCDALAKAIVSGVASPDACPVLGEEGTKKISEIMGMEIGVKEKKTAFVKCQGTCDKIQIKYNYYGIPDCRKLVLIPGKGGKQCSDGCMGYGSCVLVCPFDAIHVVNGVAKVDKERCEACGKCVLVCPNHLIELIPYDSKCAVICNSKERGKAVKDACLSGCIGCGICVKQCEEKAISLENNLAHINQDKCKGCKKCMEKCPAGSIIQP